MQKDKAMLTCAIVSGLKFNVGTVIENFILDSVYGKAITHPSLSTELCLKSKVEISKDKVKGPSMIPLPFPLKMKACPSKPTTDTLTEGGEEGVEEGAEENAPEFEDSGSEEEEENEGEHS